MPGRPMVPMRRQEPNRRAYDKKNQSKKQVKPRPIILQRIKGFEANLKVIPEVFKRSGINGCVEVVRNAIPELQKRINEEVAKGASLDGCNWKAVFIEKAAEALRRAGAKEPQINEFRQKAWQSIS
ncbi:MAG: hypothetical protein QXM75_00885 [Candidatus Diapherotrites archaeon]